MPGVRRSRDLQWISSLLCNPSSLLPDFSRAKRRTNRERTEDRNVPSYKHRRRFGGVVSERTPLVFLVAFTFLEHRLGNNIGHVVTTEPHWYGLGRGKLSFLMNCLPFIVHTRTHVHTPVRFILPTLFISARPWNWSPLVLTLTLYHMRFSRCQLDLIRVAQK